MDSKSKETVDLANLAIALEKAVTMDFIAREHGANVFKAFLKSTSLDVTKKAPTIDERKNTLKGGD